MRTCVVGLGYIGLPTAIMLAANGAKVVGVDKSSQRIESLKQHILPFEEDSMEVLFQKAIANGLTFTSEYPRADVYIISVPTPYLPETKKVDASYVEAAVKSVLSLADSDAIIVIESTISPGTIDRFIRPIVERSGKRIHLAHAPERIIPGNMVYELQHNNRVIGADHLEVATRIRDLYAAFCDGRIELTDIRTAEMTKVVENTFRDINIAYANELARICREEGVDVYEVIRIANMHPRVNILQPGPGVGGHCISVDPWFLVGEHPELAQLIQCAREVNDSMPDYVLGRIRCIMKEHGISSMDHVGLYGLTYKENVDDTRESPTLQLLNRPETESVQVYDPYVTEDLVANQHHSFESFINTVDLIVIMVGHNEIRDRTDLLSHKLVLDTRNIFKGSCVYHL